MFKRIDHVEIIPIDVEQTIDFYVNILGFKVKSRHEMDRPPMKEIVYLELGDTVIELIGAENPLPPWKNVPVPLQGYSETARAYHRKAFPSVPGDHAYSPAVH